MHDKFWGSEGPLNLFSSKLMTITPRGGLRTFRANLALCATMSIENKTADCSNLKLHEQYQSMAELVQLNPTPIPSLRNFVNKKVGNQIN